ncbi:MAG: cytochrome c-type biogenesis protein CcmH [Gammaproteobacteria bacterium]|nr:cytochrome c-type biogenesis protein CcmH [Gammaproteobacteria bacterium]
MTVKQIITGLLLASWVCLVQAGIYAFEFDDPKKEARFKHLSEELRCLVCQNQTLADSGAGLAMDLRKELYRMVNENASDEEIKNFMVSRYGDFVLYNPPIKTSTYLLWFGPFVLVVLGLFMLVRMVRKVGQQSTQTLSAEDHKRVQDLLADKEEK